MIGVRAQVFETYAMLYRELGDVARAREFYERGARDYDRAGIELARCELLDEQALLELQIGNLAAARKLIDQLINARRTFDDELCNQTAALTLGRILIAQGEEESASAELDSALGYFRRNGLYYYEAQACIALAQCDFASGRDVQMLEHCGARWTWLRAMIMNIGCGGNWRRIRNYSQCLKWPSCCRLTRASIWLLKWCYGSHPQRSRFKKYRLSRSPI